jgi:CheY-like chemotaxis protein
VEGAGSGKAALEKVRNDAMDLILLDLKLPDMTGMDVLRALKSDPRTEKLPIVVLSGYGGAEERQEAERLGVGAFLAKPVDMSRVLERIKGLVEESGTAARGAGKD